MGDTIVIEGTGAEVARVLATMPATRFRAVVVEPGPAEDQGLVESSASTQTHSEWSREFRTWAAEHRRLTRALADSCADRESIYAGRD